jgi:hypothetical protein
MLRFKQLITEASAKHFAHIKDFDPENNPDHKDILDAYNSSGMPTHKASSIKTFQHLKDTVAPHYQKIKEKKELERKSQDAFDKGDVKLVHHDPETGLKVYKVHNENGAHAVGHDTEWCTAKKDATPKERKAAFNTYDKNGNDSHVIHTREKGNLSKIGIFGVNHFKPHTSGVGGNFQDKGNVTVDPDDWEHLKNKYKLHHVKALEGVRGLPLSNETREKQKKEASEELTHHIDTYNKDYNDRQKNPNHSNFVSHAFNNLTKKLKTASENDILNHSHIKNLSHHHVYELSHDMNKPHELDMLHDYHAPYVRYNVANHRNTSSDTLHKMRNDKDEDVIHKVMGHKNTRTNTLHDITNNKNHDPSVRVKAQEQIKDREEKRKQGDAFVSKLHTYPDDILPILHGHYERNKGDNVDEEEHHKEIHAKIAAEMDRRGIGRDGA